MDFAKTQTNKIFMVKYPFIVMLWIEQAYPQIESVSWMSQEPGCYTEVTK